MTNLNLMLPTELTPECVLYGGSELANKGVRHRNIEQLATDMMQGFK